MRNETSITSNDQARGKKSNDSLQLNRKNKKPKVPPAKNGVVVQRLQLLKGLERQSSGEATHPRICKLQSKDDSIKVRGREGGVKRKMPLIRTSGPFRGP